METVEYSIAYLEISKEFDEYTRTGISLGSLFKKFGKQNIREEIFFFRRF